MDLRTLKSIVKFTAGTGMALSILLLSLVVIAWLYDEHAMRYVLFSLLFFLFNALVYFVLRKESMQLDIKGSIVAVNLIWILLGVAGTIVLKIALPLSVADAFFESISGFTTTGATIFSDIESLPHTVLFARSLMHWVGGMGIIVLGVGLFSIINPSGSMALFKAESTGVRSEKVTARIKDTALRLWGIYVALTVVDAIALKLAGMSFFDALNHAFSTISTGGFSTRNASIGAYGSDLIVWITTLFMLLSGINFMAHLRFVQSGSFAGYKREEVRLYLILFFLLSSALVASYLFAHPSQTLFYAVTHACFTVASVMSTTGFASVDYAQWGQMAVAVVFAVMILGGNAGSTAGGVKTVRWIVMFKNLKEQFYKTLHPGAMSDLFLNGERLSESVLSSTAVFFFLFLLSVGAVSLYLFASGYDMLTSLSTALACVGNVGPGFGLTGPAQNYAFFSDTQKWVLSVAMIVGRLEFFTVFLLLSPAFWKRF